MDKEDEDFPSLKQAVSLKDQRAEGGGFFIGW